MIGKVVTMMRTAEVGPAPGNLRRRRLLAAIAAPIWAPALALLTTGAEARSSLADCPSAWAPYSADTVLLDLLIDPRTKALLEQRGILQTVPVWRKNPQPPTFAAISSLRQSTSTLPPGLDAALAAIPITEEAALRRCARYDHVAPNLAKPDRHPAILVFEKILGFRDEPSVRAAHKALEDLARRRGWSITFSENGAVFNEAQLKAYQAIIWNNVSGDALTVPQQKAFRNYLGRGGGFVGVHGSAGDSIYLWDWYADTLLGARFIGHPMNPQFQSAKVIVEAPGSGISAGLPDSWTMTEEWYSFKHSPRAKGVTVIARLDESSYKPGPLAMGDHPIAWTRCIGRGRSFYTAIGHRPESYTEPNAARLLENGVAWAIGEGGPACKG